MLRCGRHFAIWCAAFFFTGTRTYLASLAAPEQAKIQGSSTQAWPQENWFQGEEEGESRTPSSTPAPRISLAEEGREGDVQSRVVLPMHQSGLHQSGEQGMVRQLWTTLHSGEVVAQELETKQISKQEKETRTAKEQDRRCSSSTESFNTLWEGGRGSTRSRGRSNQCPVDYVNANESIDPQNTNYQWKHSHGNLFWRERQGEGQEWERHWGRTRIAAEACTSQAASGSQGNRGSRSVEQHPGCRRNGPRTAVTETYPQSSDSAAEGRTIKNHYSGRNSELGHSMERVARVYDKETPRAERPLPGETRETSHEVRRSQLQDHRLEGGDQDSGGVDDCGEGRRGGVLVGRSGGSSVLESSRLDRVVRRGTRVDGGHTRRRRQAEVGTYNSRFPSKETQEMRVTFEDNIHVRVFGEDDIQAKLSFFVTQDDLARWDSKPWALYPGDFVCRSLDALLRLGQGRGHGEWHGDLLRSGQVRRSGECHGDLFQPQRGDLRPYVPVELYNFGRERRAQEDPAARALLHAFCAQEGCNHQIRTYGLWNRPCGQRIWDGKNSEATYQWNGLRGHECAQQIWHIVSELWKDHWHLFPRAYLVGLANDGNSYNRTLDILVEFMGERTSMCNVPVLIRTISHKEASNQTFAAYVDHLASWTSVATVCGLDSERLPRKGNQGGIWFGERLVTDDRERILWPGMPITFEAPEDMQRIENEEDAQPKRARLGSDPTSSSSRRHLRDEDPDERDDDLEIEEERDVQTTRR